MVLHLVEGFRCCDAEHLAECRPACARDAVALVVCAVNVLGVLCSTVRQTHAGVLNFCIICTVIVVNLAIRVVRSCGFLAQNAGSLNAGIVGG